MRALEAYDHAEKKADLPETPMIDLITEIEFELVEAERQQDSEKQVQDTSSS